MLEASTTATPSLGARALKRVVAALPRAAVIAVGTLALAYAAAYVVVSIQHLFYPFEIEWMEGGMVDEVQRIVDGKPIYDAPTIEYVPFIYAPFYFYVSALVSKVLGVNFFSLRLVSFVSSLGTCTLIGSFVWRETKSKFAAGLAACLFLGTYKLSSSFMDIARVDSLFVLLVVASLYVLRFHTSPRGRVVAAVLLTLAFLTKQSSIFFVGTMLLWAVLMERRRAARFVLTTIGLCAGSALALNAAHHGWFVYYAFWIPRQHPSVWRMLYDFWIEDVFREFTVSVLISVVYLAFADRERRSFYGAALLGVLIISWSGRIHAGGWQNVNMPTFAVVAIVFGLGIHRAMTLVDEPETPASARLGAKLRYVALAAAAIQFATIAYDPRKFLPSNDDARAGKELLDEIEAIDGEVLVLSHGHFSAMAGKPCFAQEMAIADILGIGGGRPGAMLKKEFLDALHEKRFGGIVLDGDFFRKEVEQTYRAKRTLFASKEAFYTVVGMRTRPRTLYVPK